MHFGAGGGVAAGGSGADQFGGVEVRGVVFGEDFAFGHLGGGEGVFEKCSKGGNVNATG